MMPSQTSAVRPAYPIESVDSALRLLLLLAQRKRLRSVDVSRELGCARSTAHRLLQMLQYHGFVQQDRQSKEYRLGPALIHLGLESVRGLDIRQLSRPHLERLVLEVGETTHLLQLHPSGDLVCLDSIESPKALRVGGRAGMSMPAYASAAGRALLARLPADEIEAMYRGKSLPRLQTHTITSKAELLRELEVVRERGFAFQHSEVEADISAVAAAIPQADGRATWAITVAVPTTRLRKRDIPRIAKPTLECVRAIGESLPA